MTPSHLRAGERIEGWIALVLVTVLIAGAIGSIGVVFYLSFWWQPQQQERVHGR